VVTWGLAKAIGHATGFFIGAGILFLLGVVVLLFLCRRKVGTLPLALPSPDGRIRLFRLGVGLCWSAFVLAILLVT
jgi:hypothetical protein